MREVIVTGKNVEEATEAACKELGKTRDEVSVEIIDMPVRKLFRTIPAKVKVSVDEPEEIKEETVKIAEKATENKIQEKSIKIPIKNKSTILRVEETVEISLNEDASAKAAVVYLTEIFEAAGAVGIKIAASKQGNSTLLSVEGDNIQEIIETRGETIQALSYLADRAVNKGVDKKEDAYIRIRLDVAGYRSRREGELGALATKMANEVLQTKRSRTLAPMNPYERLIIHTTIGPIDGIVSESIGSDVERRVVIKSTAANASSGDDWKEGAGQNRGRAGNNNRPNQARGHSGGRPQQKRNNYEEKKEQRTNTPEREYADKPKNDAGPVVPERREAISDGDNLPLYGKIDIKNVK